MKDNGILMYHFIVNPAAQSGKGMKIWKKLLPILVEWQVPYEVYFTKGTGDVCGYIRTLEETIDPDQPMQKIRLVALGGDGTINEIIQGISNPASTLLSYIPAGSSNDLARGLKFGKRTPKEQLIFLLKHPNITPMDVGICTVNNQSRLFAVSCGIGFDAAVCKEALRSPLKKVLNCLGLGKLTYLAIALRQLIRAERVSCDLYLNEQKVIHLDNFLFITAMIHRFEGGGFCFCPYADWRDGLLDICIIGDISKLKLLCILPTAFYGKHNEFHNVSLYRVAHIKIKTSQPLFIHTDGEANIQSDELVITCDSKRISFFGIEEEPYEHHFYKI